MIRMVLVARAMDRMAILAHPPKGEPSPLRAGAPPSKWAEAAGLGGPAHDLLHPLGAVDLGEMSAEEIAREALGKLCVLGLVEGWPDATCYRPVRLRSP